MAAGEPKTSNELAEDRTSLAIDRTVMAASRTLMAWVRTALSLISFGFTLYKFLASAAQKAADGLINPGGPRRLGLFLIGLGILSVAFGAIEYVQTIKRLNALSGTRLKAVNFSFILVLLIGLLGLFLFLTILTHTEVF